MARLLISAAHKSSGKTTVSLGLCAAFTARGLRVQPFKKGPDFIDPIWLSQAAGRDCLNLDPYLMSGDQVRSMFARYSLSADLSLVEGNKGLYDGLSLDGSNSSAALAHLLDMPVVLVLDARGMTRGIAPLILGYQAFDPHIRIAGVILNQLGGARHEAKLRAVIEHYTDVKVLGAIGHDPELAVLERHLGLMPSHELAEPQQVVSAIASRISAQVDLDQIQVVASTVSPFMADSQLLPPAGCVASAGHVKVRIGIAQDKSFGFYYPDDLQAMERAGAEIVRFDTLTDPVLPDVDGLFIGGGFPEVFMSELSANAGMRRSIRDAIDEGLPVYAECGGLMYLARSLRWHGQEVEMVGALPADVQMHERPVGRGYVTLTAGPDAPWLAGVGQDLIRGHEFHYSSLVNLSPDIRFAYRVERGHGVDGARDGLVYRNVLASYTHLRSGAGSSWSEAFVAFVRSVMAGRRQPESPAVQPYLMVIGDEHVGVDPEGYLLSPEQWSEEFALARATHEQLVLTDAHWELIYFLRDYYQQHQVQAQVRSMIKHFTGRWGAERGSNHHLHAMFPMGGPQKQGNRLAGLMKTKGEH